jgi:hypothetical protein
MIDKILKRANRAIRRGICRWFGHRTGQLEWMGSRFVYCKRCDHYVCVTRRQKAAPS